jgi:hypothetical protein
MAGVNDAIVALHNAGFSNSELATGAAIGYAESGFNANAVHHDANGTTDYGVWQINSVHGYPEIASGAWANIATNAQLARRVYEAQGWDAWSTHKPSDPIGYARYTAFLPVAVTAVTAKYGVSAGAQSGAAGAASAVGGGAAGAGDVLSSAVDIAKEPLGVLKWLTEPSSWVRIGKVAVGLTFIVGGALVIARKPIGVVAQQGAQVAAKAAVAA